MRFLAIKALVALGLLFAPAVAQATDTQSCLAASEKGQRSRAAGKLRDAQKQFALCADTACPGMVRRDCGQWLGELGPLMPTVVFGAKDRAGRDLFDVMVTMDGEPLQRSLDGKAVQVDPGPHLFLFEIGGQPGVTERVLVKEGEKARSVTVVLGPEPTPPPKRSEEPAHDAGPERHHTAAPWVVVGLGAAALVTGVTIVLTRPSLPSNCDSNTETCVRVGNETEAQYSSEQNQAGDHDSRLKLGLVVGAVGIAVLAGGLVWHFLEPTGPASAITIAPWKTADASGLAVGGRF